MMAIVPMTVTIANTWNVSMSGKATSELAMDWPKLGIFDAVPKRLQDHVSFLLKPARRRSSGRQP